MLGSLESVGESEGKVFCLEGEEARRGVVIVIIGGAGGCIALHIGDRSPGADEAYSSGGAKIPSRSVSSRADRSSEAMLSENSDSLEKER